MIRSATSCKRDVVPNTSILLDVLVLLKHFRAVPSHKPATPTEVRGCRLRCCRLRLAQLLLQPPFRGQADASDRAFSYDQDPKWLSGHRGACIALTSPNWGYSGLAAAPSATRPTAATTHSGAVEHDQGASTVMSSFEAPAEVRNLPLGQVASIGPKERVHMPLSGVACATRRMHSRRAPAKCACFDRKF
jgi:hypothetical protein